MTSKIIPQFIEIPANKQSISKRKPIFGVGINDADYIVSPIINGKQKTCVFYLTWKSMLARCFYMPYHKYRPTYTQCTVTTKWLLFSSFKSWMKNQDWKGKQLDKDIVTPRNKHYSPENCVFIPSKLNNLILDSNAIRGSHPQGVCLEKNIHKFRASCKVDGKQNKLGYFTTPEEASQAYKQFKSNHITEIASQQTDERIKNGLLKHAELLRTS